MGRPKYESPFVVISFRVDPEMADRIRKLGPQSKIVREILEYQIPIMERKKKGRNVKCQLCEDYRYLTDEGRPAKGQPFGPCVHSCPECNPKGTRYSRHKTGVLPYVARDRKRPRRKGR